MKAGVCRLISALALIAVSTVASASSKVEADHTKAKQLSQQQIADLLGWVPSKDPSNLCAGTYTEPTNITSVGNPNKPNQSSTSVTAEGPALFSSSGRSVLQKNVVVTQPGRVVKADKAYIYRDGHSGKITAIELVGHVRFQQRGKLILSDHAYLNLEDDSSVLDGGLYHLYYKKDGSKSYNAWGQAAQIKRHANGVIDLNQKASYTTCPPDNPSWMIQAKHIQLDRNKEVGKAYGVVVKFHGVPFLYTPYYSFALDKSRKSGILAPIVGYNNTNGADIALPIYWNIAPNYDMTITPRILSKRGFQANGLFRFISNTSQGRYFGNFLPGDNAFQSFKQDTLNDYADTPENQPYLNAIRNYSNNRWMVTVNQHSAFSDGWRADFNINQVSDAYYLSDFDITANGATANQLLNKADLEYLGQHWDFTALFQGYQTLHPINQAVTIDQYQRLPEIDSVARYPGLGGLVDFNMDTSLINFGYHSAFVPNLPTGQRAHFRPSFSMPLNWAAGYITPSVYLDNTDYSVNHPLPGQKQGIARTLPLVDVDSGLYLERPFSIGSHHLISTFEPELLYLFVPYNNQNDIPNYDTYRLPFSYSQLFAINRFTGVDRIQNANQFSFGVTSRILNSSDGRERLKLDTGVIYYMAQPKVCLNAGCKPTTNNFSPVVSDVTFYPLSHWATTATWAWDPNINQTNNAAVTVNYIRDNTHLFTLQYNYVNDEDSPKYTNLAGGAYFPIGHHWNAIAYAYYNITEKRPDSYYFGLEYDTCCWSIRLLTDREYQSTTPPPNSSNQYSTGYYVQINLKGLGVVGNKNTDNLLTRTLPGYNPKLR